MSRCCDSGFQCPGVPMSLKACPSLWRCAGHAVHPRLPEKKRQKQRYAGMAQTPTPLCRNVTLSLTTDRNWHRRPCQSPEPCLCLDLPQPIEKSGSLLEEVNNTSPSMISWLAPTTARAETAKSAVISLGRASRGWTGDHRGPLRAELGTSRLPPWTKGTLRNRSWQVFILQMYPKTWDYQDKVSRKESSTSNHRLRLTEEPLPLLLCYKTHEKSDPQLLSPRVTVQKQRIRTDGFHCRTRWRLRFTRQWWPHTEKRGP